MPHLISPFLPPALRKIDRVFVPKECGSLCRDEFRALLQRGAMANKGRLPTVPKEKSECRSETCKVGFQQTR